MRRSTWVSFKIPLIIPVTPARRSVPPASFSRDRQLTIFPKPPLSSFDTPDRSRTTRVRFSWSSSSTAISKRLHSTPICSGPFSSSVTMPGLSSFRTICTEPPSRETRHVNRKAKHYPATLPESSIGRAIRCGGFALVARELADHPGAIGERVQQRVSPTGGQERRHLLIHGLVRLRKEAHKLPRRRNRKFPHRDYKADVT